jgi:zinc/manganese transport system substrate-binding protein
MNTRSASSPWWIATAVLLLAGAGTVQAAPLRVVCSTTDLAAIARAVGGAAVQVEAIAYGQQDPHYVQAKPSTMRLLNRADLLIYNGLQLEIGWLPLLIEGARNPRVSRAAGQIDASEAIAPLEIPIGNVNRSMGDVHPEGNPHYTLDPRNAVKVAALIADRLSQLNPAHAEAFGAGRRSFSDRLEVRRIDWERRAASWRGRQVISYHKQFEYLVDWLGLNVVTYVEDRPGIAPSPRHVSEVVARMQQDDIRLVLQSTFTDPKPGTRVAERGGGRVVTLPAAVGAVDGTGDYLDLLETIVDRLDVGFQKVGDAR